MTQQKIRSHDLYQDVALEILTGDESDLIPDNGTVLFERPISEKLLKAIADFHSGIPINVLLFTQTFKRRKAQMLMAKKGMDGQR